MATFSKFEEIISWKEARELNRAVGKLIDKKRFENNYKLINQIEESSGSILYNIAEGFERSGNKEFVEFLFIAKGSCGELRSQLYRALDRNYIAEEEFNLILLHGMKVSSLIQKLINYLQNTPLKGIKYKNRNIEKTETSQTFETSETSETSETFGTFGTFGTSETS